MEAPARAPEDLYGLPLEEFTPARDALAKELKAAGRKDEAAEVKSLRKPSLAAWALNRAARDHPDAVEQLRATGADLRAAQEEALSGDAGRLRDAGRALSDEIDRVAALAADALRDAGRPATAAQQEKLAATLRTAAVDDAAGDVLARGVLVDDLDATGFTLLASGSGALAAPPPSSARATRPAGADGAADGKGAGTLPGAERPAKKSKADKEAVEAVEAARRELRRCDAEADQAATRARRKAERAEAAAKRAAEAQREADEARSLAEDAAGEAEAARRRAEEASAGLAAAEAALDA
ncbi:MAG TPA: hypothetical protein VFS16_08870 [Acidimicrobiia bacterium]|nr:hypothetical protein [Acidimicrobiia bacterium]